MEAQYINPFLTATKTVFKTMLSIDVSLGKPAVKPDYVTYADITGFLGLVGDRKGFVRLCFKQKTAFFVYKSLLFEDADQIGPEVVDALGEVMNIIAGQARKEIEAASMNVKVENPVIIVGQDMGRYPAEKLPVLSLPLSFLADNAQETVEVDFAFA